MTYHDKVAIFSFYSFVRIRDCSILQPQILSRAKRKLVYGTVLIASEGINGSISGKEEDLRYMIDELAKLTNTKDISVRVNYCDKQPFKKIKVKIKNEIVSLKYDRGLDVEKLKGEYINAQQWDKFIQRDDVVTIDTRNNYEVKIGSFKGAVNPNTETFREFPNWVEQNLDMLKDKKVAMFCTGGIRCEKSTALLKDMGIKNVFHLKGGILQYLKDTENINNIWQGECFVFDDRGAISADLSPTEGFWVGKGQTAKTVSDSK